MFIMSIISCITKNLRPDHFSIMDQLLKYLASNQDQNIMFKRKPKLLLVGYLDFDWVGNYANRKSILRFVFTLNERPINYGSKKNYSYNVIIHRG